MIDIKKENYNQPQSPPASATAAGAAVPATETADPKKDSLKAVEAAADAAKPFISTGRRIHNEVTYRGIDWLLNSTVGVAFAYWASRTHAGEKYFGKPVSSFFKKILKPVLKNPRNVEEGSKWGTMFAGIMAGGFTIIPPMMVMENKNIKKGVIRWLDEKIYGEKTVTEDPKFEASYRAIDEEPKKGFGAGMVSRLVAILPLIALSVITTTNKPLIKYLYDPIGKVSKWTMDKVGIRPDKMLREGKLEHLNGDPKMPKRFQSNWDFLHRTIGFDFGLTIFYSMLHEAAYKTLAAAGKGKKPHAVTAVAASPETARTLPEALKTDEKPLWAARETAPAGSFQDAILQPSEAKGAVLSV